MPHVAGGVKFRLPCEIFNNFLRINKCNFPTRHCLSAHVGSSSMNFIRLVLRVRLKVGEIALRTPAKNVLPSCTRQMRVASSDSGISCHGLVAPSAECNSAARFNNTSRLVPRRSTFSNPPTFNHTLVLHHHAAIHREHLAGNVACRRAG